MTSPLRLGAAALVLVSTPLTAADTDDAKNPTLEAVMRCRGIADGVQRLACFDKSVEALQTATTNRDIVVVDRGEIRKARHSLFGFNLPSLNIFGNDGDRKGKGPDVEQEEQEITSTVTSAHRDADGYWVITIADGAVWHQTGGMIVLGPKPGTAITIRRAALGSYFIRVGKQPGVKGRRES